MSHIDSLRTNDLPRSIDRVEPARGSAVRSIDNPPVRRGEDSVELSPSARSASRTDVRTELVDRVKEQIRSGTYETEFRLDVAAERAYRALSGD